MCDAVKKTLINNPPSGLSTDDLLSFQVIPTRLLAAATLGEVDLNELARETLAGAGLNEFGKWVGFDRVKQIHWGSKTASTVNR